MSFYNWLRENLTSRLPIRVQHALYLSVMPAYVLKRGVLNLFRSEKNTTTWREKMQDLTDMFSAIYQHRFSEEEIVQWFREEGLLNIKTAYTEEYGFGTYGDAPARDQDLTVSHRWAEGA